MDLTLLKGIAAVTLLFVTAFCSSLPLCLFSRTSDVSNSRRRRYGRVLNLLNCFGGGVFLGTFLLHLLPDVKYQFDEIFKLACKQVTFPVDTFLVGIGYLLMLGVERMVQVYQMTERQPILGHGHSHNTEEPQIQESNYGTTPERALETPERLDDHSIHQDQSSHSPLRSVILVCALSLHSVFEGLAIGLENSVADCLSLLLAVLLHKSVIAFTLGLSLVDSKLNKASIIRSIIFFCLMSPLGTVIGLTIMSTSRGLSMEIANGILQGLACGTFLYVIFSEILPHILNSLHDMACKVFWLLLGFGLMTLLCMFFPD